MSLSPEALWLQDQLLGHIRRFFSPQAAAHAAERIRFTTRNDALTTADPIVAIPTDLPPPADPIRPYKVPFNGTHVTLWNPLPAPSGAGWNPYPNESAPLWYRQATGALIPAWDLFGTLLNLLTFAEEQDPSLRDPHGRFIASFSPRAAADLLEVPALNEAAALLVAASVSLAETGETCNNLDSLLKPPVLVLSHDCDVLSGNDRWTQSIRAFRILRPLTRLRPPKVGNLWWIARNSLAPESYYFDNVPGMIELERCFGHHSTFYCLNGSGGRFGARNGLAPIPKLRAAIPDRWDIGIHYNYDTLLNHDAFTNQLTELRTALDTPITVGRAHYLRFDPARSLSFWADHGIRVDESSGYPDRIGYRNGIAGCFRPFDPVQRRPLDIWEVPMVIMDAVIVRQYGDQAIAHFRTLIQHLSRIGGALSIVFHPGVFFNPELPEMLGIYHAMLVEARRFGAVSLTARQLVDCDR